MSVTETNDHDLPVPLASLLRSERGKRILLNLYWSLQEGLPVDVALRLVQAVPRHPALEERAGQLLNELENVVFAHPELFQFQGQPASSSGLWMTVKSAAELYELLHLAVGDEGMKDFPEAKEMGGGGERKRLTYSTIARSITNARVRFRISRMSNTGRPYPAWLSRWCQFRECFADRKLTDDALATRLRDWLGLAHLGRLPLFMLCLRKPASASVIGACRPTVCDGFTNSMFKYPAAPEYKEAACGSTADLEVLRQGGRPIDGGSEVIVHEMHFDVTTHRCEFLGISDALGYDAEVEEFHRHLLNGATTLVAAANDVASKLGMTA